MTTITATGLVRVAAAHRLTNLIIDDEITRPIREKIMDKTANYWVIYLLTCPKCMSIWSAGAIIVLSRSSLGRGLLNTLAISDAVILAETLLEKLKPPSLMN